MSLLFTILLSLQPTPVTKQCLDDLHVARLKKTVEAKFLIKVYGKNQIITLVDPNHEEFIPPDYSKEQYLSALFEVPFIEVPTHLVRTQEECEFWILQANAYRAQFKKAGKAGKEWKDRKRKELNL